MANASDTRPSLADRVNERVSATVSRRDAANAARQQIDQYQKELLPKFDELILEAAQVLKARKVPTSRIEGERVWVLGDWGLAIARNGKQYWWVTSSGGGHGSKMKRKLGRSRRRGEPTNGTGFTLPTPKTLFDAPDIWGFALVDGELKVGRGEDLQDPRIKLSEIIAAIPMV